MSSPYRLLRDLHLGVGLFAAVFLAAYALSAMQMAYAGGRLEPRSSTRSIELPDALADAEPRTLARWLMAEQGLRGGLAEVGRGAGTLRIVRPGTEHRVEIDRDGRVARVTTRAHGPVGVLNRLHHAGGLGHDYWPLELWGWLLAAVSVGLLALGATGLTMWFLRYRSVRGSVAVFLASLATGIGLLALVRLA